MFLHFFKYHGAGNDFIIVDDREENIKWTSSLIETLCHRQLGIGADGLMLLLKSTKADFKMLYFNADGHEGSMCGNGGRCIAAFAYEQLKIVQSKMCFDAIDGMHEAHILNSKMVALKMQDVSEIEWKEDVTILNTGSPHYIMKVNDLQNYDVFSNGRKIRKQSEFQPKGINVNFIEEGKDSIFIRTYERGVENETLACGTGVTAVAIASAKKATGKFEKKIQTKKGDLFTVTFEKKSPLTAENIVLIGPVQYVFNGTIDLLTFS